MPMAKDRRLFAAFTVPGIGLYQWKVMPFGLHLARLQLASVLRTGAQRGKLNVVVDGLSRQPCEVFQQMAEVETPCRWIQGMKVKIRECAEKFSD